MARAIKIEHIIEEVSDFYDVPLSDVVGMNRSHETQRARWMCWLIMREARGMSYPEIGKRFNGRYINHASVYSGIKRLKEKYQDWELDYDAIETKLLERYEQE